MKIVQVVHGFPPSTPGGVETYTKNLATVLQERHHQVSIFSKLSAPGRDEYTEYDERIDDLPVHSIVNNFSVPQGFVGLYKNAVIEERFAAYIARQQPDVIHFQHCSGLSATLLERAQRERWPYLVTCHDYWYICPTAHRLKPDLADCPGTHHPVNCFECLAPPAPPTSKFLPPIHADGTAYQTLRDLLPWPIRRTLLDIYDALLDRRLPVPAIIGSADPDKAGPPDLSPIRQRAAFMLDLLKACPVLTTPSEYVKQAYMDFGVPANKLTVVPLGVDLSGWSHQPQPRRAGNIIRFGYLGGLFKHKGVHVAVQAFRRLLAAQPLVLKIYGYGMPKDPYIRHLRQLSEGDKRIRFMGAFENSDLPDILQGIDVVLIPSIAQETFSFVAREATWGGVPIVASDVGALPETIEHGTNGFLAPPAEVEAWTHYMQSMVDQPALLQAMSLAQTQRPVGSLQEHAARLESLYRQALAYFGKSE